MLTEIVKTTQRPYDIPLNVAIWISFKPIIKIYLSIGAGFILTKCRVLTPELCKGISRLVLLIFMPCLLFNNIVTQIKDTDIKLFGVIVFTGFIYYVIGLGWGFIVYLLTPIPKAWFGGLLFCCMLNNCSDLPLAYVQTIGKSSFLPPDAAAKGQSYCVLIVIIFIIFTFNLGGTRLVEYDFSRNDINGDEPTVPLISLEFFKKLFKKHEETDSEKSSSSDVLPYNATDHASFLQQVRERPFGSTEVYYSTRSSAATSIDEDAPRSFQNLSRIMSNQSKPKAHTKIGHIWKTFKLKWFAIKQKNKVTTYIMNFMEDIFLPQMMALLLGITVAMIPWVRRVFVKGQNIKHFHDAPDGNPPLDFLMDFLSFFAGAQVPLGLMLLGATMASLKVGKMVPGFWKTLVLILVFKLALLPIIACGWIHRIREIGWIDKNDGMTPIVLAVASGTPSATVQIYLTLAWIDPTKPSTVLNCLAIALMAQYVFLPLSMTILMTYTVMHYV